MKSAAAIGAVLAGALSGCGQPRVTIYNRTFEPVGVFVREDVHPSITVAGDWLRVPSGVTVQVDSRNRHHALLISVDPRAGTDDSGVLAAPSSPVRIDAEASAQLEIVLDGSGENQIVRKVSRPE